TLSAIAHGGNPQDRIASPRNASCYNGGNLPPGSPRETRLQGWIHRNALALQRTGATFRKI
ncbi:hypothetical protein, partial [Nostoc sp. 106C]|uniref:hypothetical protein n=1 Tax=Nostoc sp. 106C TaxID=1932667 RepID=UPI000B73FD6D